MIKGGIPPLIHFTIVTSDTTEFPAFGQIL